MEKNEHFDDNASEEYTADHNLEIALALTESWVTNRMTNSADAIKFFEKAYKFLIYIAGQGKVEEELQYDAMSIACNLTTAWLANPKNEANADGVLQFFKDIYEYPIFTGVEEAEPVDRSPKSYANRHTNGKLH